MGSGVFVKEMYVRGESESVRDSLGRCPLDTSVHQKYLCGGCVTILPFAFVTHVGNKCRWAMFEQRGAGFALGVLNPASFGTTHGLSLSLGC